MRVLVTGGTGFVGSHTVAALVGAGHEVHLLVRAPERIGAALKPLGIEEPTHTVGDVTDAAVVEAAMTGCDAVVHAASVFSLDKRQAGAIRSTNVAGTETVLGTAQRLGLDPIVHVSSNAAVAGPEHANQTVTADSPILNPHGAYVRSKANSERVARRLQDEGAPVTITQPGTVWGPNDPHFGDGPQLVRNVLKGLIRVYPAGGLAIIDVRDVAQVHAAVVEPGRGPRRFLISGPTFPFGDIIDRLNELTGRGIWHSTAPAWSLLPMVKAMDLVQPLLPFRLPVAGEAFDILRWRIRFDGSKTWTELGYQPRDLEQTMTDMVRWMHSIGRLSDKQAGKLAVA